MSIYSMLSNKYGPENAKTVVIAVALFVGVFVAFSGGGGDNKHAASAMATASSVSRARTSDQVLAQAEAGKPWRQWSEDEVTEFMRRGLIICVKKELPAQQQCLNQINAIADDWRLTR